MNPICEVCGSKGWIEVQIDGDPAQATIQRCDTCFRYPADSDARAAYQRYRVVNAFRACSQPVLRRLLPNNSCVASTRVAIECLRRFDIEAFPRAVKWIVEFHAARKAYTSGLTEEERSTAHDQLHYDWKDTVDPWNGHLIAMTHDFLIDPSFEQAMIATDHKSEGRSVTLPFSGDPHADHKLIEYGAILDDGERITISYITTGEEDAWNSSEAWTDPGLRFVEDLIVASMKQLMG